MFQPPAPSSSPGKDSAKDSKKGYDFSQSSIENITQRGFNFGPVGSQPVNVDQTLAHLFDTLSVECSGILVHPQWKHFRHIRMLRNDQIRLSNGIWRSWHLQFQKKRKPLYCRFDIDAELNHHTKQEAVVLEGKYWKRRPDAVASEYRKWRYYREKKQVSNVNPTLDEVREKAAAIFVEVSSSMAKQRQPQEMQVDPPRPAFLQNMEDLTDKFPMDSPREPLDAYTVYDMMVQQPNLDMLNPMMDDFLNKMSEPMDIMMGRAPPNMAAFANRGDDINSTPVFTHRSQAQQSTSYTTYPAQQQQQQQQQQLSMQLSLETLQSSAASKDLPISQDPFSTAFNLLGGYQDVTMSEQARYSPSSFLSLAQEQEKSSGSALMNIQQAGNFALKCEDQMNGTGSSSSCDDNFYQSASSFQGGVGGMAGAEEMYRTQQQQQQQQQQKVEDRALDSVLSQFYQQGGSDQQQGLPPHISPGHHTPHASGHGPMFQFPSTSPSPLTSPSSLSIPVTNQQQLADQKRSGGSVSPFIRVSSAGNLPACAEGGPVRPPLERGKSEPIRHLQDKVRNLSAQHLRQVEELEKQKTIAEVQYSELLMQVLPQQAKAGPGGPSEEQKHVLQSVLADPSLVKILRSLLLSAQPLDSSQGASGASPPLIAPASHLHPRKVSTGVATPPSTMGQAFTQQVLSPTQPAGISDLQSQFMSTNNGPSPCSPSPSLPNTYGAEASSPPPPPGSLLASGTDISPTQTMLKKFKNSRNLSSTEKEVYKEIRRQSHISAEQKRRGSIKQGFDYLQMLVINASAYPSGKVSKAMILEKTLEHIHKCHTERENREKQMEALKARIEELNTAIALCQEKLPASGAPVTRQRFEENRQRFRAYVQKRSLQNYKFGVFSIIIQQLFESYNSMVSTGTVDELCRTVLAWFEQNCNLPSLRPIVMNSLKELSQRTSILSDPSQVPRQLTQYAQQIAHDHQQDDLRTRRQQQDQQQQQQQQQTTLYS